jgi:hypothetical protein
MAMDAVRARRAAEVVLPGFAIGLGAGVLIGLLGVAGGMSAGQALVATLILGIPLALCGVLYDVLLVIGRMGVGTITPAVVFWLPLFPLARVLNEALADVVAGQAVGFSGGFGGFLLYQALVSVGFAIGWVFLHDQLAPRWWLRVRDRNPVAERLFARYAEHAAAMVQRKGGGRPGRAGQPRPAGRTRKRAG